MNNPADNVGTVARIAEAFCIAMIWADAEEGTSPRVPNETRIQAQQYVHAFLSAHPDICAAALGSDDYGWHNGVHDTCAAFGHDLYLTARGHGAGFADRDALGELADKLHGAVWGNGNWQRWEVETYQARGWVYMTDRLGVQP